MGFAQRDPSEKREKRKLCPCLSKDIKKLLTDRHKLLQKSRRMKKQNDWILRKRLRNVFTKQLLQAK